MIDLMDILAFRRRAHPYLPISFPFILVTSSGRTWWPGENIVAVGPSGLM